MGQFWETLKSALRDQAVGMAKHGASTSPSHNRAAMLAARAERLEREAAARRSWTPRTVGTTDDGSAVTFREGLGENEGHTLIADGTPSGRAFDRRGEHNHYGLKREGGGRVEDDHGDRGHYTGPGH